MDSFNHQLYFITFRTVHTKAVELRDSSSPPIPDIDAQSLKKSKKLVVNSDSEWRFELTERKLCAFFRAGPQTTCMINNVFDMCVPEFQAVFELKCANEVHQHLHHVRRLTSHF